MRLPVGDHAGTESPKHFPVHVPDKYFRSEPLRRILKSLLRCVSTSSRWYAIHFPLGDQSGSVVTKPRRGRVTWRRRVPRGLIVKMAPRSPPR